ncbi:MAG: DUF2971 domain-containing protein [bacterium]|nr:DUF2971 domain-containing protein [bacterium]
MPNSIFDRIDVRADSCYKTGTITYLGSAFLQAFTPASSPFAISITSGKQMDSPEFLYKYQRLTAHSLAGLLNETVWLANPSTFNDPFDCALTLSKDSFEESIHHVINELIRSQRIKGQSTKDIEKLTPADKEAFEQLRDGLRKTANGVGVLSLSATPSHMLMWSHYADHHRGFCVEYDCGVETELRKLARPVTYIDEYPPLSITDISGPDKGRFLDISLFTKAKYWEYG